MSESDFQIGEYYGYNTGDGWRVVENDDDYVGQWPTKSQAQRACRQRLAIRITENEFLDNIQAHDTQWGRYYTYFYTWKDGKFTTFRATDTMKLRRKMEAFGIPIIIIPSDEVLIEQIARRVGLIS